MDDSPYLRRLSSQAKGSHGRASERKVAKSLGGRLTPASGAVEGAKGDIRTDDFLIEAKSTIASSMKLELDWLIKINSEAQAIGKTPALSIRFVTENGQPKRGGSFVCIPEWYFNELINKD
jgi:hypothetical protein